LGPFTGLIDDLLVQGHYAAFPWMVFLFIGMWIGKCDDGQMAAYGRPTIILGTLLAVAAEMLSAWAVYRPPTFISEDAWDLMMNSDSFPVTPLFTVSTAAGCAALIMALRIIVTNDLAIRWLSPIRSAGQLSLTLYIAHILLAVCVEKCIGHVSGTEAYLCGAYGATLSICLLSVGMANHWLRSHARGPLEQVFRRVTASEYTKRKESWVPISA
jgi:uncharacterized membrane protein YeiB